MNKEVYLLRDHKRLRKFCQRRNKDYGCADIFGCNIACPLAHLRETEYQMNLKNLELGVAYRLFERIPISKEEGRKIIEEAVKQAKKWKDNLFYQPPKQKNFKPKGDINHNQQSPQKE